MKTADLLRKLADARGLRSDYAIAKYLNITQSRVSSYRHGVTIGDELAVKIAEDIGIDAGYVLASLAAERASCTPARKAWEAAARKLSAGVAAALVLAFGVTALPGSEFTAAASNATLFIHYAQFVWMALALWCLAGAQPSGLMPTHTPGPQNRSYRV